MTISRRIIKIVFSRCGNRCAFPDCNQEITFKDKSERDAIVGIMAHIKAEKEGFARYDPKQTDEERNSADNLILLCQNHHKIIDDQPDIYSVEKLMDMKKYHENSVKQRFTKEITEITFAELNVITKYLLRNIDSEQEIESISPQLKIKKNELSADVEGLIKKGMSRKKLVDRYIDTNPDNEFGERLKEGFVKEYNQLKKDLKGDDLFEALLSFSCGASSKDKEKATGLVILSYFFEKCDVFEK